MVRDIFITFLLFSAFLIGTVVVTLWVTIDFKVPVIEVPCDGKSPRVWV